MKIDTKKILGFLLMAGLLLTASLSFAQKTERNPLLQKFEDDGGRIEFLGNAYGLAGWLAINAKGDVQYIYTTPEGALLKGLLFAPDGTLETKKQLKAYKRRAEGSQAAAPGGENPVLKSEKLYAAAEKTNWISIGDGNAPYLYVFVNVNCDHCREFWKDLDGPVKAGKIQVRLIPYGSLEENRNGAAALLSVEHPDDVWPAYAAGDKTVLGKDKIKDGAYLKVEANNAMTKNWKLPGPPFSLYRRPADGAVRVIVGQPENTMLFLSEFLK